jgi:hypothetical protein
MSAGDDITTPPEWSGRRIRRFIVVGAIIGAVVGLLFFLIKVAAVDDYAYADNPVWLLAVLVGLLGGGVIGLVVAGIGASDESA